jgi:hemerythrin-like domain-containing protein
VAAVKRNPPEAVQMSDGVVPLDTRDMVGIHEAFRRALSDAPRQLAGVTNTDRATAARLGSYLDEVLWLLHAHHGGEDELLYPLLEARVPAQASLFATMTAQHDDVTAALALARETTARFGSSASAEDAATAAAALGALQAMLEPHLDEEERAVLPIAAQVITHPEWGALPAHALGGYGGTRIWLPFGLALENMPGDLAQRIVANLPPPVAAMWEGGGSAAFIEEMAAIRALGDA